MFKVYKNESTELLLDCFEFDFQNTKIIKLCKS